MSEQIQHQIRNIIFHYVKRRYNIILKEKRVLYLERDELEEVINNIYHPEKKLLQQHIRNCLKTMLENYPGALVENIIFDIFSDEQLVKNRAFLEIEKYQTLRKSKNTSYEVTLVPHPRFGIGLNIEFEFNDVLICDIKRNPEDGTKLSAEGKVSIGDTICRINGFSLENLSNEEACKIIKQEFIIKDKEIKLELKTFDLNSEIFAEN